MFSSFDSKRINSYKSKTTCLQHCNWEHRIMGHFLRQCWCNELWNNFMCSQDFFMFYKLHCWSDINCCSTAFYNYSKSKCWSWVHRNSLCWMHKWVSNHYFWLLLNKSGCWLCDIAFGCNCSCSSKSKTTCLQHCNWEHRIMGHFLRQCWCNELWNNFMCSQDFFMFYKLHCWSDINCCSTAFYNYSKSKCWSWVHRNSLCWMHKWVSNHYFWLLLNWSGCWPLLDILVSCNCSNQFKF